MAHNLKKMNAKDTINKAAKTVKNTTKKVGKNVAKNPKTALYIGLGAVVIYGVYKIKKSIDNVGIGDSDIDNQVSGTGGNTTGATITTQLAKNLAQQLLDAFNSKEPLYGTDEKLVASVFDKIQNGADFNLVFNAFGLKDYNGHNSPPTGVWSWLDSYEKYNLVYWLRSEISESDPYNLYEVVKNRVEQAGFTF